MSGIPSVGHHPDREPSRVPEINNAPARTIVIDDGDRPVVRGFDGPEPMVPPAAHPVEPR